MSTQRAAAQVMPLDDADLERRFGGLRRLYGDDGYQRLRAARVAVIGLGGVGSWAAEALVRSGCAALHLIDLDHVAESNVHRQVHALGATLGMAKVQAMRERLADIHPGCVLHAVDAFAQADNWPGLLEGEQVDAVIDACDDARAKRALATWSLRSHVPLVMVGAAGGKRQAQAVEVADLVEVSHDPLLAGVRSRLRRDGVIPAAPGKGRSRPSGLRCVFSREPVQEPVWPSAAEGSGAACAVEGSLNCQGYGSTVTVTATFGLVAAQEVMEHLVACQVARA